MQLSSPGAYISIVLAVKHFIISYNWVGISRNQFWPVTSVHDKEQHHMGLASLQIQNCNNADVLLDSDLIYSTL